MTSSHDKKRRIEHVWFKWLTVSTRPTFIALPCLNIIKVFDMISTLTGGGHSSDTSGLCCAQCCSAISWSLPLMLCCWSWLGLCICFDFWGLLLASSASGAFNSYGATFAFTSSANALIVVVLALLFSSFCKPLCINRSQKSSLSFNGWKAIKNEEKIRFDCSKRGGRRAKQACVGSSVQETKCVCKLGWTHGTDRALWALSK